MAHPAYQTIFLGLQSFTCAELLWQCGWPKVLLNAFFFLWLALQQRFWTADFLQKHEIHSHSSCSLCAKEPEMASHILLNYVLSSGLVLDVVPDWLARPHLFRWPHTSGLVASFRARHPDPDHLHAGFDSLLLLVSWQLWKKWNSRVFDSKASHSANYGARTPSSKSWPRDTHPTVQALLVVWLN